MAEQDQAATPIPTTIPTVPTNLTTSKTTSTKPLTPSNGLISKQAQGNLSANIVKARQATDKIDAIKSKYASVYNLQKNDKIEALKNTKLNPHLLDSPYDSIANSLHRWTELSAKASSGNYTDEQKAHIASSYYDKEVAPFYAAMGSEVMPKNVWMANAYTNAPKYDINKQYQGEETSFAKGVANGTESAYGQLDRAAEFATNFIGMAVHTGNDMLRAAGKYSAAATATKGGATAWHNSVLHMQAVDTAKYGGKNYSDTAAAVTKDMPVLGAVAKFFNNDSLSSEFWKDVNPSHGFKESAASMVAETATTLPLFKVLGAANASLGIGVKSLPYIENLTNTLAKIPGGNSVAGMLTAGGEGLAYGTLTRPNEDKDKAWQDALAFAALHTVFHVTGLGAGRVKESIGSLLEKDGDSGAREKYEKHNKDLELMVNENKRPATRAERYEAHKAEVANNIAAGGVLTQKAITEHAWNHILEQESHGMTREDIRGHNADLMQKDPALNSPMLSMASYIRGLLGDRKLSDIKPDTKDYKYLQDRISKLIVDSTHALDTAVDTVKDAVSTKAMAVAGSPKAQKALAPIFAKLKDQVTKAGVKGITDEDIMRQAKAEYAKKNVEGAGRAESQRNKRPLSDAVSAAKKRRDTIDQGTYTERTRFTTNKKGEPAVSYSFNKDYKSYLRGKAGSLEPGELSKFYEDMEPSDFNKDLQDHFYPKDLAEAGVYFEHETHREGVDNPNFLAFMYNYKDQMPKELGDEISRRIQDTPKFEKYFKGSKDVESQVRFYALQMYNHVDDFLAIPKRTNPGKKSEGINIFRSTQSDLLNPTVYQHELLKEREMQEKKNIKSMFKSPVQQEQALAAYDVFAKERRTQFSMKPSLKRAERIRVLSDEIDSQQTKSGSMIPWRF